MTGPATKMRAALVALLGPPNREHGLEASYLVGTIGFEDCEAMDVAAAAMASPIPCLPGGRPLLDLAPFLDGTIKIAHGSTRMTLTRAEADVLLALLLRSRMQRRKEARNG